MSTSMISKMALTVFTAICTGFCMYNGYTDGIIVSISLMIYNGIRVELEFLREQINDINKKQ